MADALKQGTVIEAWVYDPQGRNPKFRPLVVITPNEEIVQFDSIVAVGITGEFSDPLEYSEIPLTYSGRVGRKARTGLKKPCVALCTWIEEIAKDKITRILGELPERETTKVVNRVDDLNQDISEDGESLNG